MVLSSKRGANKNAAVPQAKRNGNGFPKLGSQPPMGGTRFCFYIDGIVMWQCIFSSSRALGITRIVLCLQEPVSFG